MELGDSQRHNLGRLRVASFPSTGRQVDERLQWVRLVFDPAIHHLVDLSANWFAWWHSLSIHDVWSLLPFQAGELDCPPECTTRRFMKQDHLDITREGRWAAT